MIPPRGSRVWLVASVALLAGLVIGDVSVSRHDTILIPLYGISALLTALGSSVAATTAIGVACVAAALGVGLSVNDFDHDQGVVRLLAVAITANLAAWIAWLRVRLEFALRRERFLARAGELLSASTDYRDTLAQVTEVTVPDLADWATLDLLGPEHRIDRVAVAHVDPEKIAVAHEVHRRWPTRYDAPAGLGAVLRTGEALLVEEITDAMLAAGVPDPEELALLRKLHLRSVMYVPLTARGRTLGALTLVAAESGRRFTQRDFVFAQELARRCAAAIDAAGLLDATEDARAELQEAFSALSAQTSRYETLLTALSEVGEGMMVLEGERLVYANPAFEAMTGYDLAELQALESIFELALPDTRREARRRAQARVQENRTDPEYALAITRKDGTRVDLEIAGAPLQIEDRTQLVVVGRDVTARRRAESDREAAGQRATLLAEASSLFDQTLDVKRTLELAAELAVDLADTCEIWVQSDSALVPAVHTARDFDLQGILARIHERYPLDVDAEHPMRSAVQRGAGSVLADVTDETLQRMARSDEHLELLRGLATRAAIFVPLRARSRTLGIMSLGFSDPLEDERAAELLALFEDLARRAALAIDNARLYEERASVARTLQRSLLPPELPSVPGMDLAARYVAAGEGNEVGGDFYDCFSTGAGDWAVVIGDVCGKGAEAAAVTALARYTIRASVLHSRAPAAVLSELNEALLRQHLDYRFCTVLYAALTPHEDRVSVCLATGGHPLPVLLRADGTTEFAGSSGTLLGIVGDPQISSDEVDLRPGDSLIMFTDGVIEASPIDDSFGPERLAEFVAGLAGKDAAEIAAAIETAVLDIQGGTVRDDVAVIVARVC